MGERSKPSAISIVASPSLRQGYHLEPCPDTRTASSQHLARAHQAVANEWGDRIPVGIIYQLETRAAYEAQLPALASGPVIHQPRLSRERFEGLKRRFQRLRPIPLPRTCLRASSSASHRAARQRRNSWCAASSKDWPTFSRRSFVTLFAPVSPKTCIGVFDLDRRSRTL